MTFRLLRPAMMRLLAALMLAVVALHAVAPTGASLERRTGSAFSAETHDVSLAGKRKPAGREAVSARYDGDHAFHAAVIAEEAMRPGARSPVTANRPPPVRGPPLHTPTRLASNSPRGPPLH